MLSIEDEENSVLWLHSLHHHQWRWWTATISPWIASWWKDSRWTEEQRWEESEQTESTSRAMSCKITISFGKFFFYPALFWVFFWNFSNKDFWLFHNGIVTMSRCTAWVGDKYIGEVNCPFRTFPRQKYWQSLYNRCASLIHTLW